MKMGDRLPIAICFGVTIGMLFGISVKLSEIIDLLGG